MLMRKKEKPIHSSEYSLRTWNPYVDKKTFLR